MDTSLDNPVALADLSFITPIGIWDLYLVVRLVCVRAQHEYLVRRLRVARPNQGFVLVVHREDNIGLLNHTGCQELCPMIVQRDSEFLGHFQGTRVDAASRNRIHTGRNDRDASLIAV